MKATTIRNEYKILPEDFLNKSITCFERKCIASLKRPITIPVDIPVKIRIKTVLKYFICFEKFLIIINFLSQIVASSFLATNKSLRNAHGVKCTPK